MKIVFCFFAMLFFTGMACAHKNEDASRFAIDLSLLTIVDSINDEHDDNDVADAFIPSDS